MAQFVEDWKRAKEEAQSRKADNLDIFSLEPDVTVQLTVAELRDLYHQGFSQGMGEYEKDVIVRGEIV